MPTNATLYTKDQISTEQYHAETGLGEGKWVTRSMLKCYLEDPPGFKDRYIDNNPLCQFHGNDATDFGTLFDAYVLDGQRTPPSNWVRLPKDYVGEKEVKVKDAKAKGWGPDNLPPRARWDEGKKRVMVSYTADWNGNAGPCKAWKAEQESKGRVIATDADFAKYDLMDHMFSKMDDTVQGRAFMDALRNGEIITGEVIRWTCHRTGLPLQVQLDARWPSAGLVIDVKTYGPADLGRFPNHADRYGYALQESMYTDAVQQAGYDCRAFLFAVWQSNFPYRGRMVQLPRQQAAWGDDDYLAALGGIASGNYDALDNGQVYVPELPAYMLYARESET